MKDYRKILRRLISHPSEAMQTVRRMLYHWRPPNTCARCGCVGGQHVHRTDGRGVRTYRCKHCRKAWCELLGTPLYGSKIPPAKWLEAVLGWAGSTAGRSGAETGRQLGIQRKHGWSLMARIRVSFGAKADARGFPRFSGVAEADEAWFGSGDAQEILLGVVQRSPRKAFLVPVPDVKEATLAPLVEAVLEPGSALCTDCRNAYDGSFLKFRHHRTNHSAKEYARTEEDGFKAHSNTMENLWGCLKGSIRAVHHGITKKYRSSYVAQFLLKWCHQNPVTLYFEALALLLIPTFRGT